MFWHILLITLVTCIYCEEDVLEKYKTEISEVVKFITARREGIEYPRIGGLVRLGFHDCVGKEGCNGCIDVDLKSNAGLKQHVEGLNKVYNKLPVKNKMTRADFYILASLTALEIAHGGNIEKPIDFVITKRFLPLFVIGRTDCAVNKGEQSLFPKAISGIDKTIAFFKDNFDLSPKETTALLGAHTLGRAHRDASGFNGPWVPPATETSTSDPFTFGPEGLLNNEYYIQLTKGWHQVDKNRPSNRKRPAKEQKIQWQRCNQKNMMLNVDAALVWKFTSIGDLGKATCQRFNGIDVNGVAKGPIDVDGKKRNIRCKTPSKTQQFVIEYAQDGKKWLDDFSRVIPKIYNKGIGKNTVIRKQIEYLEKEITELHDELDNKV